MFIVFFKRIKQIRNEIARVKHALSKEPERAMLNVRRLSGDLVASSGPSASTMSGAASSSSAGKSLSPKKMACTRKDQAALKKPEEPLKKEGVTGGGTAGTSTVTPMSTTELLQKTAKKINRRRRIGKSHSLEAIPDSFRVYRGQQDREISDSESNLSLTGSTCSSCSGFSGSGTESEFGTSVDEDQSFCDTEMSSNRTVLLINDLFSTCVSQTI